MIASQHLEKNPNLYIFIPLLYTVWSDSVLTPDEIKSLHQIIEKQEWLTSEERKILLEQLDPLAQPAPDEFKGWMDEIRNVLSPVAIDNRDRLVDIGIKLALSHNGGQMNDMLIQAKTSMEQLEETLGFIQNESIFRFKPENRKTITQQQSTHYQFDVPKLTAILDGEHAGIIRRV